ncbi:hypothetical protein [Ruegeria sp.]|uniref:hypothetical protein n=1 Tax=Ruegeria sp. TaxID=1879320 RepID=UPI00231F4D9F|nr:hypothetical protein [Ruegeria sp.]MDA7966186.1 hypothetical protein [Ruegeria sp.]
MDWNFETISSVMELAGDAGAATGKVAKGLETLKTLFKKAETDGDTNLKIALSELAVQVANAQVANSDLKLKLAKLQDELAKAQSFKSDLERYELWETPTGAIVYRLKQASQGSQPKHYLCPNCVEDRHKSILQGHEEHRKCPRCSTEYRFATSESVTFSRRSDDWAAW